MIGHAPSGARSADVDDRRPSAELSVRVKDNAGHAMGQHVRLSYIAQLSVRQEVQVYNAEAFTKYVAYCLAKTRQAAISIQRLLLAGR